jgi:predicted small lipoprotein YifL
MKKCIILGLISLCGLVACGVKGELYYPDTVEQRQTQ